MQLLPPFAPAHTIEAVPYVCFVEGDFSDQFIYFQEYQHRAAQQGRFPNWNPHIYMGQPFHADGQSAMLFPFDWIYFLFDPDSARGWLAILRLWVSASALFCLLRKVDLEPLAAFTGGAVWIFCSFNMHWLAWPQSNALTANYLFRGVFVPAGKHKVEWNYYAPGLAAGVIISVVTLLTVLATLFAAEIHRRMRPISKLSTLPGSAK